MIEVRYAGVVVGRSAIIRELDTRGLFLGITEPMPVGTPVFLRIGDKAGADEVPGRVEVVSESQELAHAGMRIRFADPAAASLFGTPVQAPPEPEPLFAPAVTAPPAGVPQGASAPEHAAPDAPHSALPTGPRRIVVDASADRQRAAATAATAAAASSAAPLPQDMAGEDDDDLSGSVTSGDTGRIAAPDPSAFGGGGGGKRGRRNRRR